MTELHDLVDQLTRDHQTPTATIGGITCLRPDPPLLTALAAARTANLSSGGSASASPSAVRLNIEASELHTAIQKQTRQWAIAADVPRHWVLAAGQPVDWRDPAALLRAWHTRSLADPHLDATTYVATLRRWTTAITDLVIDPPRRWTLNAPCPICGHRYAGPRGEEVDALLITERDPVQNSEALCRNPDCQAHWTGVDGARQLALDIDRQRGAA